MKLRLGVVLVVLASVVLIATTFSDWYLVTATSQGHTVFELVPHSADGTLVRMTQSPWDHDKARAIAVVVAALVALVAAVLGHVEKVSARAAALVAALAALVPVGAFVARLAGERNAAAFSLVVHVDFLTGFFVAAITAGALLVAAAINLAQLTASGSS